MVMVLGTELSVLGQLSYHHTGFCELSHFGLHQSGSQWSFWSELGYHVGDNDWPLNLVLDSAETFQPFPSARMTVH